MAAYYGRALVDTLHERIGDASLLRTRDDLVPGASGVNGAWLRVIAHDGERDGGRRGVYGDDGPSFDYRFDALQVGLDLYRAIDDDRAQRHAGAYLAYGRGKGEVRHQMLDVDFHAGSDEFRARTVGAYWTGYHRTGAYLDAVAQYTWYDLRVRSTRLPDTFTHGNGIVASLETGWPFAPGADPQDGAGGAWRIEPQAQLLWQRVQIDDLVDRLATVRFGGDDSWVGRIGVRVNRFGGQDGHRAGRHATATWLRANLWHQFSGTPVTEFSSASGYVPFRSELDDSWAELGLGGTWQVSASGYLFADVDYTWSLDGKETAWNGKLGMRWHW